MSMTADYTHQTPLSLVTAEQREILTLRARVAELTASLASMDRSDAYKRYQSEIAILTAERDRLGEALDRILCQPKSCGANMLQIAFDARNPKPTPPPPTRP